MVKSYPDVLFDELKLLAMFPEESHLSGLKIHSDANQSVSECAKSLFDKGMITQSDGGYLTEFGKETVVQLHRILDILNQ